MADIFTPSEYVFLKKQVVISQFAQKIVREDFLFRPKNKIQAENSCTVFDDNFDKIILF